MKSFNEEPFALFGGAAGTAARRSSPRLLSRALRVTINAAGPLTWKTDASHRTAVQGGDNFETRRIVDARFSAN
jgi:hypothetical protein